MISSRRYHFIIPAEEEEDEAAAAMAGRSRMNGGGMMELCPNCQEPAAAEEDEGLYCRLCGLETVPAGRSRSSRSSVLELNTHLLHGFLHCNGFGHLLRVNGRENGSAIATGSELVEVWDRICAMLRARYSRSGCVLGFVFRVVCSGFRALRGLQRLWIYSMDGWIGWMDGLDGFDRCIDGLDGLDRWIGSMHRWIRWIRSMDSIDGRI
jgi:hypothetical protein